MSDSALALLIPILSVCLSMGAGIVWILAGVGRRTGRSVRTPGSSRAGRRQGCKDVEDPVQIRSTSAGATIPCMRQPVPLDHCTRLLNHGPTVLVSAEHEGRRNVMAAA